MVFSVVEAGASSWTFGPQRRRRGPILVEPADRENRLYHRPQSAAATGSGWGSYGPRREIRRALQWLLQQFTFTVEYRPGAINANADAPSRLTFGTPPRPTSSARSARRAETSSTARRS
eukprot:Polyplicarium_translucidae@DN3210_c0_g1_i1.p4